MAKNKKALGIILARKGSKGVKGKNMQPIGGVPLIARTIRTAKQCRLIDEIVVSTDWTELADIARKEGAIVVKRPKDLSGDHVSSEDCITHVFSRVQSSHDITALIQNTNPYHNADDMAEAIEMVDGKYNSAITVYETHRYRWHLGDDSAVPAYKRRANRQDLPPWFEEAGNLYVFRRSQWAGSLFNTPTGVVIIPWWRALDIHSPEDIEIAELLGGLCSTD